MKYILYIGLYLLITGLFIFYAIINAPVCDEDGNQIEDSKLEKWRKKIKK